jgi:hypothetical protein
VIARDLVIGKEQNLTQDEEIYKISSSAKTADVEKQKPLTTKDTKEHRGVIW